jgi:hypothetical protein
MSRLFVSAIVAAFACAACGSPQTTNDAAPSTTPNGVPRTADGKPDLTGVWQGGNGRKGTWEEANSGLGVGGTGLDPSAPSNPASQQVITDPAPYKPEAAARVVESFNRRGIDDPAALCLPLGVPRLSLVGLFPIQIVQTPTQIVILHEYMSVFRVIPLNAEHPADVVPTHMGDSVGRWEGDTLVVETVGVKDNGWHDIDGSPQTDAVKYTERFRRLNYGTMKIDVTIDDPKAYTAPFTVRVNQKLMVDERVDAELIEFICAENERDVERMKFLK